MPEAEVETALEAPLFPRRSSFQPARSRFVLHCTLFLATGVTTFITGSLFHAENSPSPGHWAEVLYHPARWVEGAPYACSVLVILLAHEMGHYLACRYYRIPASLPYFLPGIPILGTFGAFIRIRGPIPDRKSLFDVGIAGPIAGFVVALPILLYGMSQSRVIPLDQAQDSEFFVGFPLLFLAAQSWYFPNAPDNTVLSLSPYLSAAWVGMLATSLNLLPAGQLDGGHLCYAISRKLHSRMSRATLVAVILLGAFHQAWLLWAVALLFLGERHPPLLEEREPLSTGRRLLAVVALIILLLCFMPIPIRLRS